MKKYIVFVAALVVLAGCAKDIQNNVHDGSSRELRFIVNEDVISKASLDVTNGFRWNASADAEKFGAFADDETHAPSTAVEVGMDKRATVTVAVSSSASNAYLYYGSAYNQVPNTSTPDCFFTMSSSQVQSSAGTLDSMTDRIILASSKIGISGGASEIATSLSMLSSFICFNIYDSNGTDETITSVEFEADAITSGFNLSGQMHVVFPFASAPYVTGDSGVNSNDVTVSLSSPYDLTSITSKTSAQGVFMGVMPAVVSGYTISVTTNVGVYRFATDASITFTAGKVKPINIDLQKATTKPGAGAASLEFTYQNMGPFNLGKSGADLAYTGSLNALTYTSTDILATVKADYTLLTITVSDDALSWLHASWVNAANGTDFNMKIQADPNTTALARTGYIYLTYNGTKSTTYLTVNQDAGPYYVVTPTLTKVYLADINKDGETIAEAAMLSLDINGTPSVDIAADMATYEVTISCGAATATVTDAAGHVQIVFPANETASTKNYTLTVTGATSSSITFTQAAGTGGGGAPTYNYTITKNNGNGSGVIWGMGTNATNSNDFTITDASLSGSPVDLTDSDVQSAIIAQAFSIEEPQSGEMPDGYSGYSYDADALTIVVTGTPTSTRLELGVHSWATNQYRAKISWIEDNGTVAGHWFVFIP